MGHLSSVPAEPNLHITLVQVPDTYVVKSLPDDLCFPLQVFPAEAETRHPCCALSEFLTHSLSEHIKQFLFHFITFGEVCYAAVDNWNKSSAVLSQFFQSSALLIDQNHPL